jgi:hypothetical protein
MMGNPSIAEMCKRLKFFNWILEQCIW